MAIETRRGEPTPPIAFGPPDGPPPASGSLARRLESAHVDVPEAVLQRLGSVCPVVADPAALDEAGRDWWPLALGWAVAGQLPARPALVVRPGTADAVAEVLRICNEARIPVTAAAGRSGVCGASVPVHGGVALDMTGLAGIVSVDDTSLVLDVAAGTFGDVLEDDLRADHGMTLGHWPQSMQLSTVGGWLACRSAGQYSTRYGKIEDMVLGLSVVLADGTVVRTGGRAPRSAVGPDLNQLFIGSEGTLGVITSASLHIHPVPSGSGRGAWGFTSFTDGLDACRRALRRGATPAVLRLYDAVESKRTFDLETNVLLVLDEGDPAIVDAVMSVVAGECAKAARLDDGLVEHWVERRNDVSALPALVSRGIVLDTIEVAARWSALPALYSQAIAALSAIDGMMACSAHESHAYTDGACLYFTWAARMPEGAAVGGPEALALYRSAWDAVTSVTLELGGALSHHHGVGLNRSRYVPEALGAPAYGVLTTLKAALDPNGILNPGKFGFPSPWDASGGPNGSAAGRRDPWAP